MSQKVKQRITYAIAGVFLAVMLSMLVIDAGQESATMDESVHIAAGYTYVQARDFRLNPEHPPLIKDLVGLAVSTLHVNYPFTYFYKHISCEYQNGYDFLFRSKNNAEAILFRGRLPIIAITILLGLFVFRWSSELNGRAAGLFSLLLFAFDPNIIAHGHLVTHDIAISAAMMINLYFVWRFLKKPSIFSLVLAGLTFGIALTTKFSAPLLLPMYLALIIYSSFKGHEEGIGDEPGQNYLGASVVERLRFYSLSFIAICFIALLVVYLIYMPNMAHMAASTQSSIIKMKLSWASPGYAAWLANIAFKPLSYYILGFDLVMVHVTGGHRVFVLGGLSRGEHYYYPLVFLIKSTIPLLSLIIISFVFGRSVRSNSRVAEVALLAGIATFALVASATHLDLGVRYLLPIYPFFYVYAGKFVKLFDMRSFGRYFGGVFDMKQSALSLAIVILGAWQIFTCLNIAPYHLSYFNEAVGPVRGSEIVSDSNVDWGQGLERLRTYVDQHGIDRIYVDYFGGSVVDYYLGDKCTLWSADKKGRPHGWFAVSLNSYALGTASGEYAWLRAYKPVARIGYSMLVFRLP